MSLLFISLFSAVFTCVRLCIIASLVNPAWSAVTSSIPQVIERMRSGPLQQHQLFISRRHTAASGSNACTTLYSNVHCLCYVHLGTLLNSLTKKAVYCITLVITYQKNVQITQWNIIFFRPYSIINTRVPLINRFVREVFKFA